MALAADILTLKLEQVRNTVSKQSTSCSWIKLEQDHFSLELVLFHFMDKNQSAETYHPMGKSSHQIDVLKYIPYCIASVPSILEKKKYVEMIQ